MVRGMETETISIDGHIYRIIPTVEDGNCLFRALSWWTLGTQSGHYELRQQATQYVVQNWSDFKNFLAYDSPQQYQTIMGRPGTYGGHPEVFAVSLLFNAKVSIYFRNAEDHKPAVVTPPGPHARHFRLLHSGIYDFGHYDVLY